MLEFNQEHKVADLSAIKSKTEKVKNAGKVMLCGVTLSAVLLLSGCGSPNTITNGNNAAEPIISSSAIIMENGNAMIVDLQSYKKYTQDLGSKLYQTFADDRTWVLYTSTGDRILVDFDSVKFIEGEEAHEKAETMAQGLISENGQITCYNEAQSYGKTR